MEEVYVLTIHDEDTFQILGIYNSFEKFRDSEVK